MRRNAVLVLSLIAALSFSGICCCSSTPAEPEPLEGPEEPDIATAGWDGSSGGRAPVVIYPESSGAPAAAPAAVPASGSQPMPRGTMNDFVAENRQLRQRVDSLSREVDAMRSDREAAMSPAPAAREVPMSAGTAGGAPALPASAGPRLTVEAVRAALVEAGAGQIQVALSPQNEVYLTLPGTISFGSGKADLKPGAQALIARAVAAVKSRHPSLKVRVEGHTDSDPIRKSNWPSNMALSKARADAVAAHLVRSTPLTPAEVESRGFGETRPVASNTSKAGKAENRRCEIVLLP